MNHAPTRKIAVDAGNSGLKIALPRFEATGSAGACQPFALVLSLPHATTTDSQWNRQLDEFLRPCDDVKLEWCVVSVSGRTESRLARWVGSVRPQDRYTRLRHTDLPIQVDVERPERVGLDRLAAAVAVNHLRAADLPAIIVDAGTAITVDLVRADGCFAGGAILPGVRASAAGLAAAAEALPFVTLPRFSESVPLVGRSTEQAIRSGLVWGCVGAVRELVTRLTEVVGGKATVYCTGGSGAGIAARLGPDLHLDEHLVLRGAVLAQTRIGR